MSLVDAINSAANSAARVGLTAFPDLCDLIAPRLTDGGASGDTIGPQTVATGVRCFYESAVSNSQNVIGGVAYAATHEIMLEGTNQTVLITPEYKIRVHARPGKAELIFEKPVVREASYAPLVTVTATLVQQGYR